MVRICLRSGANLVDVQFDADDMYKVESPSKLAKELMEWLEKR
jgi:hypothetical protein